MYCNGFESIYLDNDLVSNSLKILTERKKELNIILILIHIQREKRKNFSEHLKIILYKKVSLIQRYNIARTSICNFTKELLLQKL